MFNRVFLLALFVFFVPCVLASKLTDFNQSFSKTLAKDLKYYNIPGAAYIIVKNNQVIALETFGYIDKTKKTKVNANTVFRLASVSKTFASTITTMLAKDHQLNLTDPITKYVPNFELASKGAADKIQLQHILSHSSGLMPNAYDNLLHENWSMEKIIGRFDRVTPICEPAKCYGYQNIAYGFLQPAIEASQPKTFPQLLQEKIFTPLKMNNASVGIDVYKQQSNTAKPHILMKRKKTNKKNKQGQRIYQYLWRQVNVDPDYYKVEAAAGINASITDMGKWLIANLGHNPKVLSPQLLEELTAPRIKTKKDLRRKHWKKHLKDAHYGYGWRIYQLEDYNIIYHSGWVEGFRADIGYSPELDVGFAVLINAESNMINKTSSDFWTSIGDVILNKTK